MRARCDQISRGQDSGKFKTTFVFDSSAIITDLWKLQCFMVSTFFHFHMCACRFPVFVFFMLTGKSEIYFDILTVNNSPCVPSCSYWIFLVLLKVQKMGKVEVVRQVVFFLASG